MDLGSISPNATPRSGPEARDGQPAVRKHSDPGAVSDHIASSVPLAADSVQIRHRSDDVADKISTDERLASKQGEDRAEFSSPFGERASRARGALGPLELTPERIDEIRRKLSEETSARQDRFMRVALRILRSEPLGAPLEMTF